MHSWISKPGFPLLSVVTQENKIELKQERFYVHHNPSSRSDTVWPIPLLTHEADDMLLDKKQMTLKNMDDQFIKLNVGQTGFYRVFYDEKQYKKLSRMITEGEIVPIDRLGILSDAFESVKNGKMDAVSLFEFLGSYYKENNSAVWDVITDILGTTKKVMNSDDIRNDIKPYIRKIAKEEFNRLGWDEVDNEDYFDKMLRTTIIGLNAAADEKSVILKINQLFESAKKSSDINPDLKGIIYATVAKNGSKKEYNKLLKFYEESESSEDKVVITMALCSFEQKELIRQSLSMIKSDKVRLQDVSYWLAYCFSNRFSKLMTWEWTKENWQWLKDNLGKDMSFSRLPLYAASSFNNSDFLKEFKNYFKANKDQSLERSIKQAIEIMEWHINWQKRDQQNLIKYFKNIKY